MRNGGQKGQQESKPRCGNCGTEVAKTTRGRAEKAAAEAKVAQSEIQQQRAVAQRAQQQQREMQAQQGERMAQHRGMIQGAARGGMPQQPQQMGPQPQMGGQRPQAQQSLDPRLATILQALAAQQRSRR